MQILSRSWVAVFELSRKKTEIASVQTCARAQALARRFFDDESVTRLTMDNADTFCREAYKCMGNDGNVSECAPRATPCER